MFETVESSIGQVTVATTQNRGHSVDYWSEEATKRIVSVGGKSHPLIAQQAEAFKESVSSVILFYMKEAIKSDRTTLIAQLEQQGHQDMAEILRSL